MSGAALNPGVPLPILGQSDAGFSDEFPGGLDVPEVDRRRFLKLMAASLALGGMSACRRPPREEIVPTVWPQPNADGVPLYFATALTRSGLAHGVLVRSYMGRPIKIEGNPDHPASLGATDVFAQAELLTLYDPQRSQAVRRAGQIDTRAHFQAEFVARLQRLKPVRGRGLRLLTGRTSSPTLLAQIRLLLKEFPEARWHVHEPLDPAALGTAPMDGGWPEYDLSAADVVVALNADFLFAAPGALRYARQFAARRSGRAGQRPLRLHVAEVAPTTTGAKADWRIAATPAELQTFADFFWTGARATGNAARQAGPAGWLARAVAELSAVGPRGVLLTGAILGGAGQARARRVNIRNGAVDTTVRYLESPFAGAPEAFSLSELVDEMLSGAVDTLLILDSDPVYSAPVELEFSRALARVEQVVHAGLYVDETAQRAQWHLPLAHELESWSDARSDDGTAAIIQPLIAPLYGGQTAAEILAGVLLPPPISARDLVRAQWGSTWQLNGRAFEARWREALRLGVINGTRSRPIESASRVATNSEPLPEWEEHVPAPDQREPMIDLQFVPDPTIWDGRYAFNAWLQELPKPLTKLVWDNALLIGPGWAAEQHLQTGDRITLARGDHTLDVAVLVQPGHADGAGTLSLGYGRRGLAGSDESAGFNAYALRDSATLWRAPNVACRKLLGTYPLVTTQAHHTMDGRDLVRVVGESSQAEPTEPGMAPGAVNPALRPGESLYPTPPHSGPQWGMVIDLAACIGCNACVLACQAENNIPVVGKNEVQRGREMHWIRIDRYFSGDPQTPEIYFQPVTCMHCEQAPCELVCPVGATVHSRDGLNEMVYNRCIGTRYCSNNCPYKVRRFNFYQNHAADEPAVRKLLYNPEVTVRGRGVMEKCTYCVQRIRAAEITARRDNRSIADGEAITACQQVCPAEAIIFGNLNDSQSRVRQAAGRPHNYALLAELNTRPRTTYLPERRARGGAGGRA